MRAILAQTCDFDEIGAQTFERRPALADARRLIVGKLTEVASAIRQKEHRTVGKPRPHPRPHTIGDDTFQRGLAHPLVDTAMLVIDERGRQTTGQGVTAFGAAWYAIAASGRKVEESSDSSSGSSSSGSGSGYGW